MSGCEFRAIVETAPDVIARFSPELRHLYVNPAVELATGIPAEEFVGRTNEEMGMPAALCASWDESLRQVFRSGTDRVIEFEYPGPVTNAFYRGRITPEFSGDGTVRSAVVIAQNRSEQMRAEAAHRASEAHYHRLVDRAPDGIYALDVDGRITEMNQKAGEILGRVPGELIGTHFSNLLDAESAARAGESLKQRLSGEGETTDMEVTVLRPTGEPRVVQLRSTAIIQAGRVLGTHGIARDVTVDRVREGQLRRAERFASVGTLLSGVAHELNNPLHAIRNFAQLLLLDPRSEEDREALEIMQREADRAARIVADLRFVSRQSLDQGGDREAVDLNDIVRHVLKMRRYVMDTRGIEVREDLAVDLPMVQANRSEMDQVALNLVLNAEAALTDAPGARRLTLRTSASPGGARLVVEDSGPGIDTDNLERIFDPFWTTKSPGEGTGLGLSLVHSIITEHSGNIRVASEPGRGAAFTITLPAAGESSPIAAEQIIDRPFRKLRILVVDDEPGVRTSVSRYLKLRGHVADEGIDGADALRLIKSQPEYDIVLCDLRMPGMSGDELLERLHQMGDGIQEKFVFMTGDAASEDSSRILEATGAPVLIKPVNLTEIARVVEEHANQDNT